MNNFMSICTGIKLFKAVLAGIGLFTFMNSFMSHFFSNGIEFLVTKLTRKWLLSTMNLLMPPLISQTFFAAVLTGEEFFTCMSLFMSPLISN